MYHYRDHWIATTLWEGSGQVLADHRAQAQILEPLSCDPVRSAIVLLGANGKGYDGCEREGSSAHVLVLKDGKRRTQLGAHELRGGSFHQQHTEASGGCASAMLGCR